MAGKAKEFKSITEEVKYHINQMLGDGLEHSRTDILTYVRANVKKAELVTENLFTGALKNLVGNQKVKAVARGIYKLREEGDMQIDLKERVHYIIENCKERLNEVCCINILEVSEADMETAKQVKEFISAMDKMVENLEEKGAVTKKEKKL